MTKNTESQKVTPVSMGLIGLIALAIIVLIIGIIVRATGNRPAYTKISPNLINELGIDLEGVTLLSGAPVNFGQNVSFLGMTEETDYKKIFADAPIIPRTLDVASYDTRSAYDTVRDTQSGNSTGDPEELIVRDVTEGAEILGISTESLSYGKGSVYTYEGVEGDTNALLIDIDFDDLPVHENHTYTLWLMNPVHEQVLSLGEVMPGSGEEPRDRRHYVVVSGENITRENFPIMRLGLSEKENTGKVEAVILEGYLVEVEGL